MSRVKHHRALRAVPSRASAALCLALLAATVTGAAACSSPGGGDGSPGAPSTFRYYDVNHVLGTGQSLSLGAMGTPPLSMEQPYKNVMFDTGLGPSDRTPTAFVPLVETTTFLDAPVETPSSSFANFATKLAAEKSLASLAPEMRRHDLLVTLHGLSGASYPMVGKNTDPYRTGLAQVKAAKSIAEAQGKSYIVRAITAVHGESDGWENWNKDYANALIEWQASYDADIKAITGQTSDIPMFHSQYSAWSAVESTPSDIIPFLQLEAHERAPGKVVLVGPKYHLPYAKDGFHLTNEGYRWLGEYYAKAYSRQVLEGKPWEPVRPKTIKAAGHLITVTFFVPAPPLVLDTQLVTNPGSFGFEVADGGGAPVAISKVEVTGPDTVTITVASVPSAGARVRYAFSGLPKHSGGPEDGPRGNLRDSDNTVSRFGYKLYDWCLHFDEPLQ